MNPIVHEPDPFNYPFPKRSQLMSLSTINENQDFLPKKVKKFQSYRQYNTNLKVDDIQGAQTKVPGYQFQNKPNLSNQNWDIDRTGPRALHIGLNKPEYNLQVDDIDKTKPQFQKFKTNRVVNPLNPNYSLPKTEMVPVDPPKFIRDGINNDDIDGAQPKKPKYFKTRETMKLDDIDGTKTKPALKRNGKYSSFDYDDVTKDYFRTKRSTNPLEPTYFHKVEDTGVAEVIGEIEGSKPNPFSDRKNGPNALNLDVTDIDGTKPGSKGVRAFNHYQRREVRPANKTDDINGTQVGSLKKAPATKRATNPLNPEYPLLGAKELDNYDMYNENQPVNTKPVTAPVKTRSEMKRHKTERVPNFDKEAYKRDLANFYTTEPGFMQEIDFKKISKNCKPPQPNRPANSAKLREVQSNKNFKRNSKQFYQVPLSDKSELSYARNQFYRPESSNAGSQKDLSTHEAMERFKNINDPHRKTTTALEIDSKAQHYKRDLAKFYGESYQPSEGSELGSIFQHNAAEFYGENHPEHGEQPYKIDKQKLQDPSKEKKPQSVLNQRRLKQHETNMQRNPTFSKNLRRFYGMKSYGKSTFYGNTTCIFWFIVAITL